MWKALAESGGAGQGAGQPSEQPGVGGAMGARGQGAGGDAPLAKTPTGKKMQKENVKVTGGDIIARQLVKAEQMTGEARKQLQQVVGEALRGAEEGVNEKRVPGHLKEVHRHYFGRLKQALDAGEKSGG
jgi:hypothetical protein